MKMFDRIIVVLMNKTQKKNGNEIYLVAFDNRKKTEGQIMGLISER